MNIMELGAIGELVGGVAVIASLAYVGLQIRQNTSAVRANSAQGFADSINAVQLQISSGGETARAWRRFYEEPESLTALRAGVPMQLDWIVSKLLSKEAEYRYQTAADLLADLKSLDLSGSGTSRRSMPAVEVARSTETSTTRIPIWMWGLLVGVAVLAAASSWLLKPTPFDEERAVVRFDLELETNLNRTGRRSVGSVQLWDFA